MLEEIQNWIDEYKEPNEEKALKYIDSIIEDKERFFSQWDGQDKKRMAEHYKVQLDLFRKIKEMMLSGGRSKECENCGQLYQFKTEKSKYCSERCKMQHHRKKQ
ncbi:MAG: hypothetical protein WC967_14770 [Balneolaceae bacterium]